MRGDIPPWLTLNDSDFDYTTDDMNDVGVGGVGEEGRSVGRSVQAQGRARASAAVHCAGAVRCRRAAALKRATGHRRSLYR